jgi:hypothetical protein
MPLAKAIQLLELQTKSPFNRAFPDIVSAVRLLINAGKRIQNIRGDCTELPGAILPGETSEATDCPRSIPVATLYGAFSYN